MSPRQRWFSIFIVAVALGFRIFALDAKPAHFDEGVNGSFAIGMRSEGCYRYDPGNYHGPLHFYVLFAGQQLFGRSLWVARMPTVLLGTATVALMLAFRRFIPWRVAWIAALAAAISPAMVFYSRYAIHETWLPFFMLLGVYGGFGIARGEKRTSDLWVLCIGLAGMMLTKETYIIHWCAAAAAIAATRFLDWYAPLEIAQRPRPADLFSGESSRSPGFTDSGGARSGSRRFGLRKIAFVSLACTGIVIAFYSGFGLHWAGVPGMIETFQLMYKKGTTAEVGHNKEFFYWLKLFAFYEWAALVGLMAAPMLALRRSPMLAAGLLAGGALLAGSGFLGRQGELPGLAAPDYLAPHWNLDSITSLGLWILVCSFSLFVAVPSQSREVRWLCLYGLASLTGYSLVPYKTPWCIINLLWPFLFALGQVVENFAQSVDRRLVYLVGLMLAWTPLSECWRLNFVRPTDDGHRYVYVQTTPDINKLLEPMRELVRDNPLHRQMRGLVLTEAFPLSWELSDFPNISYLDGDASVEVHDADFILIPAHREAEFDEHLLGIYFKEDCLIRSGGEDGRLYLNAERFFPVFQDRVPEFRPRVPQPNPSAQHETPPP
jgi:uncharacterized protein (TIGR03663 family)